MLALVMPTAEPMISSDAAGPRPTIRLLPGHQKRARHGHPWIYSNEIVMDAAAKSLAPGTVVKLQASSGETLGCGFFNPRSLVAARMLASDPAVEIDADFFDAHLERALALRSALYPEPYYRLIHAEADGLPGLAIDRYGDVLAVQVNSAGIERALDALLAALDRVLAPRAIVLRNDSPVRALEGLESYVRVAKGDIEGPVELKENGARFLADLASGQKTGWFYDQRDNRAFMADLSRGRRAVDLYCHSGGFAIAAAAAGAEDVLGIDSSAHALELAMGAAALNHVEGRTHFERGQAFETMERLAREGRRFEIVICDPPAFVKSKRDLATGAKGYRKLARLAAELAAPGAFVFLASCSHNMETAHFANEVARGIGQAGRSGRILRSSGAAPDHPVHPQLPESAYLKAQVLQLD
jgi:23S rRNA (cytosine1962-C5)-methyltransferase